MRCTSVVACLLAASSAVAGYHEELLENDLRVILVEHRANPMVVSAVVVGAGVVHEPEKMNGASHLLEHLLFNGTETRTQKQLYDEVDSFGAYNNATTREDHTLFTLLIQKEFAASGLEIQADMLFHSVLPADKFEKEKGIVLEELARSRTAASYRASRAFREFAYRGTPLARPVLGTEESIASLSRDDVWAYYRARYVPSNMTLLVMGDFEIGAMMELVRGTFGAAPSRSSPAAVRAAWPSPPERNLLRQAFEADRVYLHAAFPVDLRPHDRGFAALDLLVDAVADGQDAPLARVLTRGADPAVLSFSLATVPRAAGWSSVEFEATLPEDADVIAVLDELQKALRALVPGSPAWDRVAAVQRAARHREILDADRIHYYAMLRSAYLLNSPEGYLRRRVDLLGAIGDADLAEAADLLRASLAKVRVTVTGAGVKEGDAAWRAGTEPLRAGTERRSRQDVTLPSGLQVGFARNEDSRVLGLHLMIRPRSASEPEGREGIAAFLHRLASRGTELRDQSTFDATLAALGIDLKTHDNPNIPYDDYYTTPEFSFVRLEMPAERWREGLALLAEIVLRPRFDPDDVEAVRAELLDLQKRRGDSPRAVAAGRLVEVLAPGHPLASSVTGSTESVGAVTLEELRSFHGRYFTARRMILTGEGPINPSEFVEAAGALFAGLPPGEEIPEATATPLTREGRTVEQQLGRGQAQLVLGYLLDVSPSDRAALELAVAILSERLAFELRERQGLAYSLGASVRPFASRMLFRAEMGTRPENVDEALRGMRERIRAFRESSFDEAEVRRAANARRGRLLMRRLTGVNRAYFAGIARLEGLPPGQDAERIDALLQVGREAVARAARRYLDPDRCVTVIVR